MPTATTPLPDHVRAFLAEPRYAAVATIDADGAPRQAVIWFLLDGDTIVINSLEGRRWPTNLRRDPRISIAVTAADARIVGRAHRDRRDRRRPGAGPGRHRGDGPPLPRPNPAQAEELDREPFRRSGG